jgi:hypothetical protein
MINSVRNTVLSVLNKNNYGYISPSDFNLYAKQAQMELFEDYFSSYNNTVNMENVRRSGTDYADIKKTIEEAVEVFYKSATLTQVSPNTNRYYVPSLATTGDDYFMIDKVLCYQISGSERIFKGQAEKVTNSRITMLTTSLLTTPSEMFPAFVQEGNIITIYPDTIQNANQVDAHYFRYPKAPKWTYISLTSGEPVFDQSQPDYQDFELPLEDEFKLVMKILQYAGMSIREIQAVQFGVAQEQQPTT